MAASMATETGFFSLPGELRNRIYNHVLADVLAATTEERTTEDFSENATQRFPGEEHKAIPLGASGHILQPAFSQTCRTIRHEFLTMLYGGRHFVGPVSAVQKFLRPLGENSKRMLRAVYITWPMATNKQDLAKACLSHVRERCGRGMLKDGVLRFEITPKGEPERTVWVSELDLAGVQASTSMLKALQRRDP